MIKKIFLYCFVLFYSNAVAHSTEFFGKFTEGGIIKGKASPNSEMFLDNKKLKISKNGYFIFGIKKGRTKDIEIKILTKGESQIFRKKIKKRDFLIQKINGLPKKWLHLEKKHWIELKKNRFFLIK